ncbi:DUF4177 domain-containing protein [Yoonia sp. SS1-5]|uniref:DUF4177 domain-containing protein n=1 Tax=Yoonia rhodophyticola TaxID=3137370 RepID=A0AAN0MDH7_9RHOB
MSYEYKVVPAPTRGLKAKGVKTPEDRFAHALATVMNELAADGWEYQRTDTLPAEQREGFMSKTTVFQNMLVFRRAKTAAAAVETPVAELMPDETIFERREPRLTAISEEPVVGNTPTLELRVPTEKSPDKRPTSDVAAE